ncbi:cytochrome P450 2B10-like [Petaurus breviceps papuanus]|uniref:cytochrome P450 2B10-like n=1 Tax=Petaurus breviceps papuanus TaxID=3040969 RepID=UPI0036DAC26A
MLLPILLCLLLLALALHSRGSKGSPGQLPPGPTPLPLLGNLLQLGPSSLDKRLMELSRHFGSVFTVHLGPQPFVVLSGASTLREALLLQADTFSGRGGMASFDRCTLGKGIVFSNGHLWHTLRTFTVGTLKKLGIGSRSIAERIQEEAAALTQELSLTKGSDLRLQEQRWKGKTGAGMVGTGAQKVTGRGADVWRQKHRDTWERGTGYVPKQQLRKERT